MCRLSIICLFLALAAGVTHDIRKHPDDIQNAEPAPKSATEYLVSAPATVGRLMPSSPPSRGPDTLRFQFREMSRIVDDFGGIAAVEVGPEGRVLVADYMTQLLSVYSRQGDRVLLLGGRGEGPGEFQGLRDIATRADTVFALDTRLQRITAFSLPEGETEYTLSLPSSEKRGIPNYSFEAPAAVGFILQYVPLTNPKSVRGREIRVRRIIGSAKRNGEPILTLPDREWLVNTDKHYGYSVSPLPFGKRPVLRLGPDDRLYTGWTGRLGVEIYNLKGERIATEHLDVDPLPVGEEDIDALYRSHREALGDAASEIIIGRLRGARDSGKLPATKPLYSDFLVDDRGRVWFELVTEAHRLASTSRGLRWTSQPLSDISADPESRWLVLLPSGSTRLGASRVPADVDLHVIRNDEAYGVSTDALGVESVVVYDIE